MAIEIRCAFGNCPTLGIDAAPLDQFADIETDDGEILVYDTDGEDAWIQSDVYYSRDDCL